MGSRGGREWMEFTQLSGKKRTELLDGDGVRCDIWSSKSHVCRCWFCFFLHTYTVRIYSNKISLSLVNIYIYIYVYIYVYINAHSFPYWFIHFRPELPGDLLIGWFGGFQNGLSPCLRIECSRVTFCWTVSRKLMRFASAGAFVHYSPAERSLAVFDTWQILAYFPFWDLW